MTGCEAFFIISITLMDMFCPAVSYRTVCSCLCVLFPWVNLVRSSVSVQRQPSVIIDLHMKKDYQKTDYFFGISVA